MSVQSLKNGNLELTSLRITDSRLKGADTELVTSYLELTAVRPEENGNQTNPLYVIREVDAGDIDPNGLLISTPLTCADLFPEQVGIQTNTDGIVYITDASNTIFYEPFATQYTPVANVPVQVGLGTVYTFSASNEPLAPETEATTIPLLDGEDNSNDYLPAGTYIVTVNIVFGNVIQDAVYGLEFSFNNALGEQPNNFADIVQAIDMYATATTTAVGEDYFLPSISASFPVYISGNNTQINLEYTADYDAGSPTPIDLRANIQTKFMRIA